MADNLFIRLPRAEVQVYKLVFKTQNGIIKKTLGEKRKSHQQADLFSFSKIFSVQKETYFFIRPSKTGRIMGSPVASEREGGRVASYSLSGAYLQNYTSYGYEILRVDRSHQRGGRGGAYES